MANQKNAKELQAKIIAHAWKNPSFKEKLLKNPKAALKEMGLNIPENIQVKVVEDKPSTFTFVLPSPPANVDEMTEHQIAAGVMGRPESQGTVKIVGACAGGGAC